MPHHDVPNHKIRDRAQIMFINGSIINKTERVVNSTTADVKDQTIVSIAKANVKVFAPNLRTRASYLQLRDHAKEIDSDSISMAKVARNSPMAVVLEIQIIGRRKANVKLNVAAAALRVRNVFFCTNTARTHYAHHTLLICAHSLARAGDGGEAHIRACVCV